jgi:cyclohexanone monooxygenase
MTQDNAGPAPARAVTDFEELDVVVVGAGFGGLYQLYKARELGLRSRLIERGSGVGGTWFWNRYPGARCDVDSVDYSYSFSEELQQEWEWTERYPTQPEILRYLEHVVERFDLGADIELSTSVVSAHFDEEACRWLVATDRGSQFSARFCIMSTGPLTVPKAPDFEGLESFEGEWYQTSRWPSERVDCTGKRVGVIGTGSSGIQAIPVIAKEAEHLTVFQRTPNFSIPANNAPLSSEFIREVKQSYPDRRRRARLTPSGMPVGPTHQSVLDLGEDDLRSELEELWETGGTPILWHFADLRRNLESNTRVADFVREKIRGMVRDPATAEKLTPTDHPFGTKRPCFDTDYFETFNRENVELVDVRTAPIERITPTGLRTAAREYDLDMLVFALGFDAMTGALLEIDIRGRGGVSLRDAWSDGPRTHLGMTAAGFPNLFFVAGPLGPMIHSAALATLEHDVEWISSCIDHLRREHIDTIETTPEAQEQWVADAQKLVEGTLYPLAKNSWYSGANIPGKKRMFLGYLGGFRTYADICASISDEGYRGFVLSRSTGSTGGA